MSASVLSARPNPAHRAVAAIERWQAARGGDFLLVTQNIDTLHEQAGSARLIKVHGSVDRCRCADPSCRMGALDSLPLEQASFDEFDREPCREALPRCPLCGTLLRPHVLWFDEYYTGHADYQWHYVDAAATQGEPTTVEGRRWSTWTDDGGDLALVREDGGTTTLVVGHDVPADELEAFVASLR